MKSMKMEKDWHWTDHGKEALPQVAHGRASAHGGRYCCSAATCWCCDFHTLESQGAEIPTFETGCNEAE